MKDHGGAHGPSHYIRIWGILLVLLVVSICGPMLEIRAITLITAFGIAVVKAWLVAAEFMHLKIEKKMISYLLVTMLLLMFVFFFGVAADIMKPDGINWEKLPIVQGQTREANALASGEAPGAEGPVDVARLVEQAAGLASKGKTIYSQQCNSCHGDGGRGDGPAAATLSPKPRDFTKGDGWKNGRKLTEIFKSITNGIPGSPMPAFGGSLSAEDRFALAAYVRSMGAAAPSDSSSDIAALQQSLGAGSKPEIPIEVAMDIFAREWEETHKRQ